MQVHTVLDLQLTLATSPCSYYVSPQPGYLSCCSAQCDELNAGTRL